MAGRRRPHHFSRRMLGGIIFLVTSIAGGFLASLGENVYSFIKGFLATKENAPVSGAEIAFVLIGAVGLSLIVSDLLDGHRSEARNKRRG